MRGSGRMLFSLLMLSSLFFAALVAGVSAAKGEQLTPPLPSFGNGCIDKRAEDIYKMLTEEPSQIILLDVRTEAEYEEEHIQIEGVETKNIPLSEIEERLNELNKSKVLIVYCRSGARSRQACEILAQHNFTVFNLEGGITAWKAAGYPTTAFNPSPTPVPTPTQTPTQMPPEATPETPAPTVSEQPAQTPQTSPVGVPGVPGFETIFAVAAVLLAVSLLRGRKLKSAEMEKRE
nr:rhodanese-like domain-containing protein [Methanophagales archaeon]